MAREVAFYRTIADVVVFDQRGGGRARPEMTCPDRKPVPSGRPFTLAVVADVMRELAVACRDRWVKAGVEFADGVAQLGVVVTDGLSDWSSAPVPEWAGERVTIRASRSGDAVTIRARTGDDAWRFVRLVPLDPALDVHAGPFVCAPTRAGLAVRFHSWGVGEPDGSLH